MTIQFHLQVSQMSPVSLTDAQALVAYQDLSENLTADMGTLLQATCRARVFTNGNGAKVALVATHQKEFVGLWAKVGG